MSVQFTHTIWLMPDVRRCICPCDGDDPTSPELTLRVGCQHAFWIVVMVCSIGCDTCNWYGSLLRHTLSSSVLSQVMHQGHLKRSFFQHMHPTSRYVADRFDVVTLTEIVSLKRDRPYIWCWWLGPMALNLARSHHNRLTWKPLVGSRVAPSCRK